MRVFTAGSVSFASAFAKVGSAATSCDSNTASAACSRVAASGENNCNCPKAASIALRTGLFTRTSFRPLDITSGAGLPVWA